MKTVIKCLFVIVIQIMIDNLFTAGNVQVAWLPLAIGAGLGLANALFGGSDRQQYSRGDLEKYGYKNFDPAKAKGDLARLISSRIKNRRAGISARNSQSGLNNPTDVYANEEDLINSQVQGDIQIDEQDRAEENAIASQLFALNEGQPRDQDFFQKFLEGGLTGANMGFNIADLMGKGVGGGVGDAGQGIYKGMRNRVGGRR